MLFGKTPIKWKARKYDVLGTNIFYWCVRQSETHWFLPPMFLARRLEMNQFLTCIHRFIWPMRNKYEFIWGCFCTQKGSCTMNETFMKNRIVNWVELATQRLWIRSGGDLFQYRYILLKCLAALFDLCLKIFVLSRFNLKLVKVF